MNKMKSSTAPKFLSKKSSNLKDSQVNAKTVSPADDGFLSVEPGEVRFEGVLPSKLYVMTFSIRNNTKAAQRIRLQPPKSGYFALNYVPAGVVAPGLDIRAEIECQIPPEAVQLSFNDRVVVTMGNHQVEVPIFASKPFADIRFSKNLDLGYIAVHQVSTVNLTFENVSEIPGTIKLQSPHDSLFRITPTKLSLEARGSQKCKGVVKVKFEGKEIGHVRELLKVNIEGALQDSFVDLAATVIEEKLTILTENRQGMLESVNFENMFFGQTKVIRALLVNSGPHQLNFGTTYGEEESAETAPEESVDSPQTDDIMAHYAKSMVVHPVEGIVKPFSHTEIIFQFKPVLKIPEKGFTRINQNEESAPKTITRRVNFTTVAESEMEQKLFLNMQGVVVSPNVEVTPNILNFGDCPVNDRRDIVIKVQNKTNFQTHFEFPVYANFKFTPTKGVLLGMETSSVVASFLPPQLGIFKHVTKLSLEKGLVTVDIKTIGNANSLGMRKTVVGGLGKTNEDFKKEYKFVNPEEEAATRFLRKRDQEAKEHERYLLLTQPKKEPKTLLGMNSTVTPAESNMVASGVEHRDDASSVASSIERDFLYGTAAPNAQQPLDQDHPMLQRRAHNRTYDLYLQRSHAQRVDAKRKEAQKRLTQKGGLDHSDPFSTDMGMERGLNEPKMRIPTATEPLWLKHPTDGDGTGGSNRIPIDENRLIVKKYSSTPSCQQEQKDCSAVLSLESQKLIIPSHKIIEFGKVSVGSVSAKNFAVTNDLKHHVLVGISDLEQELQTSKPLSQVVPPGCTAGFDIYFSSRTIGKYRKAFMWKANDSHSLKVIVSAEVVPIELVMSRQDIEMQFPPDSLDATLSTDLVLTNPGNAPADFLWGNAGAFECSPDAGTISPGNSTIISITWSPNSGKRNEEELGLHITGGVDQTLRVKGVLMDTKAEFVEKRQPLGVMAVGTEKIIVSHLRNVGAHPLVFFLNDLDENLGIKLSPMQAIVEAGETCSISVSITPKAVLNYDNTVISAKIRGGKQISFKLTGSSIVPELELGEEALHFGPVTIGSEFRLPLTISNKSSILSTLVLDLSSFPDFKPNVLDPAEEDDDNHTVVAPTSPIGNDQEDSQGNRIKLTSPSASSLQSDDDSTVAGKRKKKSNRNIWKIMILPTATIKAELVFTPSASKQHNFKLPLALQGITHDKSLYRDVTAVGVTSVLGVSTFVIDFGDRIVSRDPLSRVSYFLETALKNLNVKQGLTYEIREQSEIIKEFDSDGGSLELSANSARNIDAGDANNQIFFVAPTKGDLSPTASTPIRVTFQPQSNANYSKKLDLFINNQQDPNRPYLTLLCVGSGVYPRLTFSEQHIALPSVPLGITSRSVFTLYNNGYSALQISHRASPSIPVNLELSYPDGQHIGLMVDKIRVVVAAKSETPVSWAGKIEFYDQDGERFFLTVSGCSDCCLLTNYPFVREYQSDYGFLGLDDQPVRYLKKVEITELRQQESKRKEEQRKQRSLARMMAVEGKVPDDKRSLDGRSDSNSVKSSKMSKLNSRGVDNLLDGNSQGGNESHEGFSVEGVDPDKHPVRQVFDDTEISFLLHWLNHNVCKKKFDVFDYPGCIVKTQGDLVVDCIEHMYGRRIPGLRPADAHGAMPGGDSHGHKGSSKHGTSSADTLASSVSGGKKISEKTNKIIAANRLVYKYQQLLNFLIGKGALLGHVNAICLLDSEDFVMAQEYDLTRDRSQRYTPAMLAERRNLWETTWLVTCKSAWLELLYQAVKIFVLNRVNYKDYIKMPGVVISNPVGGNGFSATATGKDVKETKKGGEGKKKDKGPLIPKAMASSNIFTHAESVLLAWCSYHVEHASKLTDEGASAALAMADSKLISFHKRVTDLETDFKDMFGFCQLTHSHFTDATRQGEPLSGYTTVERGSADQLFYMVQASLGSIRMKLDLSSYKDVTHSSRSILLMILHMFIQLPKLVPKSRVEFSGLLSSSIAKQIELKNPTGKDVEYSVTLSGSPDFTVNSNKVVIPAEGSVDFLVTLRARFRDSVSAKLIFWSEYDTGFSSGTMSFQLVSQITGRKPLEVIERPSANLFEMESIPLQIKTPFDLDGVYQVRLEVKRLDANLDEMIQDPAESQDAKRRQKKGHQPSPMYRDLNLAPLSHADNSEDLSPAELKARDEDREMQFLFHQPFWCTEENVTLNTTNTRTIIVYMLPFVMGKYSCQVVFLEREIGEFCYEIKANVGLPKPCEKLDFRGQQGQQQMMAMRLASKNTNFDRAFAQLTETRVKNANKKIKVRSAFHRFISAPIEDEETGQSAFLFDFLSQFFVYRKPVPFVSDYMPSSRKKSAAADPFAKGIKQGLGSPTAAVTASSGKYKKMVKNLLEPALGDEANLSAQILNTLIFSFAPAKAGLYHSLGVLRARENPFDVRVVDITARASMPDAKVALEFEGPARQRITQEIPVMNESEKDWHLVVTTHGRTFSAPKTLQVKAGETVNMEVAFFGLVKGKFDGSLQLRNTEGGDNFSYNLVGVADDPLVEGNLVFHCTARKQKSFHIPISRIPRPPVNHTGRSKHGQIERRLSGASVNSGMPGEEESIQELEMETDIPHIIAAETIEVPIEGTNYNFAVQAPVGGSMQGTITFRDVDTGVMVWYAVTIHVSAPIEEKSIEVQAVVRKAAAVEITLENPTDDVLDFNVVLSGDGLLGDPVFQLQPRKISQTGVYELIYSPLITGNFVGRISFNNELVGQVWYKLNLEAIPADPVVVNLIESMVGSSAAALAPIENPLSEQVTFTVKIADPLHFSVTPDKIILGAYAQSHFEVHFRPSSLNETVNSSIIVYNEKFGEIQYQVAGRGLLPGMMPPVFIDAPLGEIGSQTVVFRNPFPHPLPLEVLLTAAEAESKKAPIVSKLKTRDRKASQEAAAAAALAAAAADKALQAFDILLRKTEGIVVQPQSPFHITLSFSPDHMGRYESILQLRSNVGGHNLLWCFPVVGVAEAGSPQYLPTVATPCKSSFINEVTIPLEGILRTDANLSVADFSTEIDCEEDTRLQVQRAFRVQPLDVVMLPEEDADTYHMPGKPSVDFALRCRLLFEPLRTFTSSIELVVCCRDRGKWRCKLQLEATEPEPDDIIKMVAAVGGVDKVTFRLNNRFLGYSPFQAYFTAKSSAHFTVTPNSGVLAPYGSEGTPFTLTFQPVGYGIIEVATLIIITDESQWNYEIRGSYPDSTINNLAVKSKIGSLR